MIQYISKDALVVEIERRIKEHKSLAAMAADNNLHNTLEANELLIRNYSNLIRFIDTLEVKEDLEIDKEHKIGKWFTGLIPCWVDAPSTLQAAHSHHGKNIVAVHLKEGGYRCCCVDDKEPMTFSLPENTSLVEGWHNRESTWSEEDELNFNQAIYVCHQHGYFGVETWLKSIKLRNTWKPNDRELEALRLTAEKDGTCLMGLYEKLKKLR